MRGGRDASRLPLLQVMMALQSATPEPKAFGGLRVALFWGHNGTAKCDLFLNAVDEAKGLRFELEYDSDLFDEATADRLLDSYACLLEAAVAEPAARIDRLPILSASDRALLEAANATSTAYPREHSIAQLFVAQARATPDRVAVTCGRKQLTYSQLNRRANQLARGLMARGVGPDVLVGVALDRSLDLVVTILAVLKAGGAYLPLDLTYPVDRVAFMVSDTQVPIVVTTRRDAPQLPPDARVLCLDDPAAALFATEDGDVELRAAAEHLAYVMYTSGSTGRPKGVAIPNRGVVRLVRGTTFVNWDDVEAMLHMAPIAFDASTFEIWGALLNGKRLVIQPDRHPGLDQLAHTLQTERVDCLWLTAALFNTVMDDRPELLRGVRQLLIGGEALSVPHVRRALDRLPSTRIINGYGPTECTTFACCYPIPAALAPDLTSVPIGTPIANTQAHVLDAHLAQVPVGVTGELYLGGDGLARGYLHQPSLTAERFVSDPFSRTPGGRLYRTGDRVRRLGDGTLEFLGRLDRQIKLRGFRIELGEIEAVIGRHPDVLQAVVVLRDDASGPPRLVAYVKARPEAASVLDGVRAFLATALPEYMVPSTLVALSTVPLTPNGKIDYAALPAPVTTEAATASEAPATPTEVALAAIWQSLLGEGPLGRHDNFFDRGGNSLVAIRLFSRVSASLGVELPFGLLLQQPTLSMLAAAIDRQRTPGAGAATASALTPLRTSGRRPPLFFTHGVGGEVWSFKALTHHLGDDQPVYGLQPVGGGVETAGTVPEIAARYIQDIRAVSPRGPYMLAGHCAGAAVAYEMARQLHAAGEPAALVVALDYWFFDTADRRLWVRVVEFLRNLPTWIRDDLRHVNLETILGRMRSKLRIVAAAAKRVFGSAEATPVDIRDRLGMWRFPDYQVAEIERAFKTFQDYQPPPYDGDLLLIRARALPLFPLRQAPDMGWGRIVRGRVTVKEVRGSHETILTEPLVSEVAEVLRDAVDRVIAERAGSSADTVPKR
jgi:amino acid adenylation domain-containing protein